MKRRAKPLLGTLVEIAFDAELPDEEVNRLSALAFQSIHDIHQLMSFHEPESDLTRINLAKPGQWVSVDIHTLKVLSCALQIERDSQGLFNAGVAPLLVKSGLLPAPCETVPAATCLADMVELNGKTVRKIAEGWIDLGGIAKGYAVDVACARLLDNGVCRFVVNAGGDLRVNGIADFEATIRDPDNPGRGVLRVSLNEEALATSACYFSDALIDPHSGKSLSSRYSVSVAAPTCMIADALTKIVACTGQIDHPILNQYMAKALIV